MIPGMYAANRRAGETVAVILAPKVHAFDVVATPPVLKGERELCRIYRWQLEANPGIGSVVPEPLPAAPSETAPSAPVPTPDSAAPPTKAKK